MSENQETSIVSTELYLERSGRVGGGEEEILSEVEVFEVHCNVTRQQITILNMTQRLKRQHHACVAHVSVHPEEKYRTLHINFSKHKIGVAKSLCNRMAKSMSQL